MTYIEFVQDYLQRQIQGEPIYTDKISDAVTTTFGIEKEKAAAAVSVALKRIKNGDRVPDLRCFQKGIYYRTTGTPFGEIGIDKEKLIAQKYLLPDKGYLTGRYLLNQMGLTTQVPAEYLIATNVARECLRYDKRLNVAVCPPKTLINKENKRYLQFLDAIDLLDKAPIDVAKPYVFLSDYIKKQNLKYEDLLYYSDRFYNQKTTIRLAHIASQGRKENESSL